MSRVRKLFEKRVQEAEKMKEFREEVSKFKSEYVQEPLSKDAILRDLKATIKKLKLENTVLKEKLSVAESQIEDLKSQLSYFENGEDV